MSTATPTYADILQYVLDDDRASLYVALPGKVEKYDAATQMVDVRPMTKRVARDGDDTRLVDELPVIPAVPVVWPRGGGYFLALPIAVGDGGLIVCCDSDLGTWRDSGQVSDPGDERRHSLSGAVFVPGLETVKNALASAPADRLRMGKDAGGPVIEVDGSFVYLGAAGGQFVALANLVLQEFNALKTAFNAWTPVPNDGGAALKTQLTSIIGSGWPHSVSATIAKAT